MKSTLVLIVGDAIVILLAVLLGLFFHQSEMTVRLQYTFVPFLSAWLLAAWTLGLYSKPSLLRVPLAAIFAAPLGAVVRAAWLGSTVIPIFAVVMAGVLTIGMLVWRTLFAFLVARRAKR